MGILQSAILVLVYLSVPLVLTPLKAQIWASLARYIACGDIPLPSAPPLARHGINFCCIACSVSLPALLGERDFMKWFTILSGTVACWINMFLPSVIVLMERVLPAIRCGDPWKTHAFAFVWIFVISCISASAALQEMSM